METEKKSFKESVKDAGENTTIATKLISWGIIGSIGTLAYLAGRRSGIKSTKG